MSKKPKSKKNVPETPASTDTGTLDLSVIEQIEIPFTETDLPIADIAAVYNARTNFDEEYIKNELAPSIAKWGIQTRLWVYKLAKPAPNGANYGLIAGEQRWRAAQLTARLMAPVKIYEVDDEGAIELGLIDNLLRRDLSELDEAFGFRKLIDDRGYKAWDPSDPAHSIGHKLNLSKTRVYAALKLTELPKLGIQAVRSGQLSPSVGVRIARIPDRKAQQAAITEAIADEWTDGAAANIIARDYMTELKGAPFDRHDEKLNPARGSCDRCPMRTGNLAELFPDLATGRGDICTDTACYRDKCSRSFKIRAREWEKKEGKVLSEKEARDIGLRENQSHIGGKWISLDDPAYYLKGAACGKTPRALLKQIKRSDADGNVALALANDGTGRHFELIDKDLLELVCKQEGLTKVERSQRSSEDRPDPRQYKEDRRRDVNIMHHQIGSVFDAAAGRISILSNLGGFMKALALWLIDERGKDVCKTVLARHAIDSRAFKLSDRREDQWTLAMRDKVESIKGAEVTELALELLLTSSTPEEGKLSNRVEPLVFFFDLDPEAIYQKAIDATPGGERIREHQRLIEALGHQVVELLSKDKKRNGMSQHAIYTKLKCDWCDLMKAIDDPRIADDSYGNIRLAVWDAQPVGEPGPEEEDQANDSEEKEERTPVSKLSAADKANIVARARARMKARAANRDPKTGIPVNPAVEEMRRQLVARQEEPTDEELDRANWDRDEYETAKAIQDEVTI